MKMLLNRIQIFSLSNSLTPLVGYLEKDKILTVPQIWLLAGLLTIFMLVPIWVGQYAPLFDYADHLLEAQVAAHYTDPQLNYAESHLINPGWYWRSNALSTLLLIGLGRVMPMTVAGHLVLSLYVLLFMGSLAWLLYRAGTAWPLLLAAPVLVYNFAFTSGWINFCYGLALVGYILILYESWRKQDQWPALLALAGVMLLTYLAHLLVWVLVVIVIATMAGMERFQWRRYGWLWLALNSAGPLLFLGWSPWLALGLLGLGPGIWVGEALMRAWNLNLRWVVSGAIVLAGVILLPIQSMEVSLRAILPQLDYYIFDKATFPLRLFSLPHQYLPPNSSLVGYNLFLLGLVLVISGLLIRKNITDLLNSKSWLLVVGALISLYILVPSHTSYIWVPEPRILLIIVLVTLPQIQLPLEGTFSRRVLGLSLGLLCLVSLVGTTRYAQVYDQQATAWQAQMAQLKPAQRILMLREKTSPYISRPTLLGVFNRFYTGEYFSTAYNIDQGGFASRIFMNGPVSPRLTIPIADYNFPRFNDVLYVAEHCAELQTAYDAVLFWGKPNERMAAELNKCFISGPQWEDMGIWYVSPP